LPDHTTGRTNAATQAFVKALPVNSQKLTEPRFRAREAEAALKEVMCMMENSETVATVEKIEKRTFVVGERVEKLCTKCEVERGHVVASRVTCPICQTRSTFKSGVKTSGSRSSQAGAPYDPSRQYRAGQTLMHPAFGLGEVTALIEPQKIDVLFADRMRRMIHARN
jgi:hypothetical protein